MTVEESREREARVDELALKYGRAAVGECESIPGAVYATLLADDVAMERWLVYEDGSSIEVSLPEVDQSAYAAPDDPPRMSERESYYYEKGKRIVEEDRAAERDGVES